MNEAPRQELIRSVMALALLAVLIVSSVWLISPFVPAIVWATTITVATWPIMLGIQKRLGGKRWAAVTVMVLALLFAFIGPLWMIISTILDHVDDVAGAIQSLQTLELKDPPAWLERVPLIGERLVVRWHELATDGKLAEKAGPYLTAFATWLVGRIGGLGAVAGQLVLTIAISGVLYAKGEAAARGLMMFGRKLSKEFGESSVVLAGQAIRGVALGVVVTALAQAILGTIGLAVVGAPWLAVLGALMFVLALAQIGVVPVLAGAIIWKYMQGEAGWGTALLVWTVAVASIDNILRPLLIKRGADLPILVIFAGVVGGLLALGLMGIFIGPVVLAVTWRLFSAWVTQEQRAADTEVQG